MRIHIPVHRRWGDQDALGHINNVSLLKLLEEARVRAFWRDEGSAEDAPLAVLDADTVSTGAGLATLIARQEIEYLAPVPYAREPLDVQMWLGKIGGSSFEICYEVMGDGGTRYARATTVVVLVDTETGRPTRLPTDARTAWEPYAEEPISYRR
ncbi:acyl-CoA thioesterase [Microbacterium suaedae]|uniref:acyl-CoA thioesterase n=1 Tax=Microbacterium suaedae TaxID=2067813 RepID=UPI000DA2460B|nr:thioesterase family protein [Microbacterium suaedae]